MKFFLLIIAFISVQGRAQKPEIIAEYINNYQQFAIEEQLRTGIPAAITMAQGIHESGAGLGVLALKSNNHFGIKCKSTWTGDKVYHDDDDTDECFRAYNSVAESFRDHSEFIKSGPRYSFLFTLDPQNYAGWANGLKQAGYATNPKYPQILIRLIEENDLESLTETAMMKEGHSEVWLASVKSSPPESVNPSRQIAVQKNEPGIKTPDKKSATATTAKQAIFKINHCKAVFALSGTTLTSIAKEQGLKVSDLVDFNDMGPSDKLAVNQIIYLEHKKKKGNNKIHEVKKGESAWLISQLEGIRLEKLLEYNHFSNNSKLKTGQLVYLKSHAPK